jgi:hypothetical protein
VEKKPYYVTALAGPVVAGVPNPGADREILLTRNQAEHALRQGYLSEKAPSVGRKAKKV